MKNYDEIFLNNLKINLKKIIFYMIKKLLMMNLDKINQNLIKKMKLVIHIKLQS